MSRKRRKRKTITIGPDEELPRGMEPLPWHFEDFDAATNGLFLITDKGFIPQEEYLPVLNQFKLESMKEAIYQSLFNIKINIVHIGWVLTEAKKVLGHGEFKPWIEETFGDDLPYGTAYAYRKIYLELREYPYAVEYLPVSFLIHMSQKSFPEEIKKLIAENPKAFSKDDIYIIDEHYKDFKKEKITLEEFKDKINAQIEKAFAVIAGKEIVKYRRSGEYKSDLPRLITFTKRINNQIGGEGGEKMRRVAAEKCDTKCLDNQTI